MLAHQPELYEVFATPVLLCDPTKPPPPVTIPTWSTVPPLIEKKTKSPALGLETFVEELYCAEATRGIDIPTDPKTYCVNPEQSNPFARDVPPQTYGLPVDKAALIADCIEPIDAPPVEGAGAGAGFLTGFGAGTGFLVGAVGAGADVVGAGAAGVGLGATVFVFD